MTIIRSIVLNCFKGNSDKTYRMQIIHGNDGYRVETQYGRRGSTLQTGTKTIAPVLALTSAEKLFSKVVDEKLAKGYVVERSEHTPSMGEVNPAAQTTQVEATAKPNTSLAICQDAAVAGQMTEHLPQLLNSIDCDRADQLNHDPMWCVQQKFDGNRTLVEVTASGVRGINRRGITIALPMSVVSAVRALKSVKDCLFDGELVGEVLHVWDVLRLNGEALAETPLAARLAKLHAIAFIGPLLGGIRIAQTWRETHDKVEALASRRQEGAEGVVYKRLDSTYKPGRPNSGGDALKLKFTASATFRVRRVNVGKRSVRMEMTDESGAWMDVGNVTIPPNHDVPSVGDIAEAQYLYAYREGSLFQPVYKGLRADQDESDCSSSQLQYKGESKDLAA